KNLSGMRRGLVMDVNPEFTSHVDGAPAAGGGGGPAYRYGQVDPQLGVNLRWGITQNLSMTGTVNPDFSQVEADVGQVTVDERVIWKKIWFSTAQFAGSWTKDAAGQLWDITLYDLTGYSYGNHAELVGISPDFKASSGFVNRVNVVHGRLFNRFTRYGKPGA